MIPEIQEYPIFEADQVLSQKHLNKLISYLEAQDRLSRIHLLGMGIVCGLEIKLPGPSRIQIECGTAVTSLGFLIPFETTLYTHFKETKLSDEFLAPDYKDHEYLKYLDPFFEYTDLYEPFKDCLELLPEDSEDAGKQPLTDEILDNKVVMLLLEVPLKDLKNCIAIDCADKGKKMAFTPRALLIDMDELEESGIKLNGCKPSYFKPNPLPRYSVPKTNLITGQNVLDAFKTQVIKGKQDIHDAIKNVHDHYFHQLGDLDGYPILANVISKINELQTKYENDYYIQYVSDWVGDLVATYHEIVEFNKCNPTTCCPVLDLFPLHVLLGSAENETIDVTSQDDLYMFRTLFIKTGILAKEENSKKEHLKGLLLRLIHQLNHFELHLDSIRKNGIRITPSKYGDVPLSDKSIPYYYADIKNLNKKWSPDLYNKGFNDQILSYHAKEAYNSSDSHVIEPLKYELESYNFFRIEGHLGMRYERALSTVAALIDRNRLPIKLVGLNASNFLKKTVDISKHQGDWGDLKLDYNMARTKVYNITEYVINWIKFNKAEIQQHHAFMTDNVINDLFDILTETRSLLKDDLQDFIFEYEDFYDVFERLKVIFAFHRWCIFKTNQDNLHKIEEDLIDHMDEIGRLFLEDPFTVIVEEAKRRWEQEYKKLFLSKFLESHPGIDHKAGVPKGGTFIMVYVDSSIFAKPKFRGVLVQGLLTRIDNYKGNFGFNEEETNKILTLSKNLIGKSKVKPVVVKDECADKVESAKGQLLDGVMLNFGNELNPALKDFLLGKLKDVVDRDVDDVQINSRIPERVIIADFYLPYLCCDGSASVNIVLPPNDENQNILADFDYLDFNDDDFFTNKPD